MDAFRITSVPFSAKRFLVISVLCAGAYFAVGLMRNESLLRKGPALVVNQHHLQVHAWLGLETAVPRLDVTPYFPAGELNPYHNHLLWDIAVVPKPTDGSAYTLQVGLPLGPAFFMLPLELLLGRFWSEQWLGPLLGGVAVAGMDALLAVWLARMATSHSFLGEGRAGVTISNPASSDRATAEPAVAIQPSPEFRNLFVLFAAVGNLFCILAVNGFVWPMAQTLGAAALTLTLLFAFYRRWFWAGTAFAFAITSRPDMLLALPVLVCMIWSKNFNPLPQSAGALTPHLDRRSRWRALGLASLAPLALGALTLLINYLRYGSPWEFGYQYDQYYLGDALTRRAAHGLVSLAFLPDNFYWMFLAPPLVVTDRQTGAWCFPWLVSHHFGMGVWFVCPAGIAIVATFRKVLWRDPLIWLVWVSVLFITLSALVFHGRSMSWGYRYLADAWPLWLMLIGLGLFCWFPRYPRLVLVLVGLSVVSNLWGLIITNRSPAIWPILG